MYTIAIFEQAMDSCGYELERAIYIPKSRNIRRIEGRIGQKRFGWNATGHCFSSSNKRYTQYDLPLQTIVESNKTQETIAFLD